MTESAKLEGAIGILDSGQRRVDKDKAFGRERIIKAKPDRPGSLNPVSFKSPEAKQKAIEVINRLESFKEFWATSFASSKTGKFEPSKELAVAVFTEAQALEADLNSLLIHHPEALKPWFDFPLLSTTPTREAMKTRVVEREKADTVWQRALAQIDGQRTRDTDGSSVLAGLDRLNKIVHTPRVGLGEFMIGPSAQKDNFKAFVEFVKANESNWGHK